jgi:hypothetical protein
MAKGMSENIDNPKFDFKSRRDERCRKKARHLEGSGQIMS